MQPNDQGAKLIGRVRGVNMRLEFAAWARVDLQKVSRAPVSEIVPLLPARKGKCVCLDGSDIR